MSTEVANIDTLQEDSAVQSWVNESIAERIAEFNANAAEMRAQAARAVVDSDKTLATAGDLARIIRGQEKSAEDVRKKLIAPVRSWLDKVNALFKVSKGDRDEAAKLLRQKSDAYQRLRAEEARKAAEIARKEAEERALRDAELAAKAGDNASAEVILELGGEAAAKIERDSKPELVRGDFGSTVGTRRVVKGEVEDINAFLRAIADGKAGQWDELLTFRVSGLNSLARELDKSGQKVPGFNVSVETSTNFK